MNKLSIDRNKHNFMHLFITYITTHPIGTKLWATCFGLTGVCCACFTAYLTFSPTHSFIQNILPSISMPISFLCVYYLGIRNNIGNILGVIANIFEMTVNIAFGNFGFYINALYYVLSHIIGYFDWKKHLNSQNKAILRNNNIKRDIYMLVFMLVFGTVLIFAAYHLKLFHYDGLSFVLIANIGIMYLSLLAQGTMLLRYRYAWWLWFAMNCLAIPVQFLTGNYVYGVMYCFYQINAIISLYSQYYIHNDNE